MPREPKGAIVSLRLPEDEQARLRELAEAQGLSVSELIRTMVRREFSDTPLTAESTTASSAAAPTGVGHGVFWETQPGTVVDGNTITVTYQGPPES